MRPYLSLLRVRVINGLQYRAAAFGGMATQLFWGTMLVFLYQAFYGGADSVSGFSYRELVTYVWLHQAFLNFIFMSEWDGDMLDMILTGGIGYELLRPVNLYQVWYVKLLSKRLSMGLLRIPPILLIGFLLPSPYNLAPPQSPLSLLLFFITICLGLFLIVAILMMVYISIFKTMSPIGSMGVLGLVGEFFGGMTIPIPLMPDWLQKICMTMPFRWVSDLPFRVYSGNVGTAEALFGIAVQCGWIALLVAAGAFIMKKVSRLKMVQGG